jgi:ferredoxin
MRAQVDEDLCVGSAMCEEICPEVFELVNDTARVKADPVPQDAEDACREAAENCPSGAITIEQ